MEASGDVNGDTLLLDSNDPNVIDTRVLKETVPKTNSTNYDAESGMLDNSTSKTKNLSDNNCNLQTEVINNGGESTSDSVKEAQFLETVISNDQLESKMTNVKDENDLNLPGNVKNINDRRQQSANSENSVLVQEMQCNLVNHAGKNLGINSEQLLTKSGATNLEGCTSGNIDHISNSTSCSGIVKQYVNDEKIDGSVTKVISDNNDVEDMVTEDHLEACNRDSGKTRDQEEINETKEKNGNPNSSIDNSEPMVTDDPVKKAKVVNETQSDSEDNTDMNNGMEGIRNESVVEAMNKDQSWKSDKVYKKDLRSLKLLCDYGSDSDGNDNEVTMNEEASNSNKTIVSSVPSVNPCPAVNQEYREPEVLAVSDSEESDSSDETSSTSSATSSSSSDETEEESEDESVVVERKAKKEIPKTKGELGLEDLPPIEDLHITVPESECVEIGKVLSIVDSLVVVQSIKGCPSLDLDSVLFLDNGHKALGEVFDVFGKVSEACYCVRFNSKDHALSKGVEVGMPVFYAPRTEYSKYVFLADLTRMKGSDASWAHNNEPPTRFLDYSDDEQERRARKGNKPPVRNVEREETQPQAKRYNWRGVKSEGGNGAPTSPRSNRSWATPFNRYVSNAPSSPPPSPCPSPGPKPLIRPSSFRNSGPPLPHGHHFERSFRAPLHHAGPGFQPPMQTPPHRNDGPPQPHFRDKSPLGGPPHWYRPQSSYMPPPPQSHFHNAAAGAPPMSGTSSQMLPPQFGRADIKYDMNIPSPQPPYSQNQNGSGTMDMNDGGYRQANLMRPTSIPNPGLFAVEPSNGFKVEDPPSFPQSEFPSLRQDFHGSYGGGPQGAFGGQQPIFMNPNVPPPPSASHQSPPSRHPHSGW
ncbi:hypothetical protein R5R35_009787 [Gryllus longicercus]|uniref:H/ACA ribonucleoprotein complex non-core subunit NAF1 n=1 Tax=Gryllus longicercus TaxID=2509291 RepID=A0AAN9Z5R6_9ORTH